MRAALLVLALVLALGTTAEAGTLFSVVTEFSKNLTETIQYTIAANVNSGQFQNVVENFVIAGSSLTFDGISTFDDRHGVYYYAPDWPVPFVFVSDVHQAKLLAPIYMGGTTILRVDFDDATDTLYTLVEATKKDKDKAAGYLVSTGPDGSAQIVFHFPPEFDFNVVVATEAYNNQYFIVSEYELTHNSTSYALSTFNLSDSTNSPTVVKIDGCKNGFIEYIVYDQSSNTFYGAAESAKGNSLEYYLWTISASGDCSPTKMDMPQGIATCFTYDQSGDILWIGFAPGGNSYFYGYNVTIPAMFKSIMIDGGVVPSSIEYSEH